jgi:hypothetical protein
MLVIGGRFEEDAALRLRRGIRACLLRVKGETRRDRMREGGEGTSRARAPRGRHLRERHNTACASKKALAEVKSHIKGCGKRWSRPEILEKRRSVTLEGV